MKPFLGPYSSHIYSITRIVVGLLYWQHGAQKLFGILGQEQTVDLFSRLGLAGVIEVVGGALILLGLFTPWVAFIASGELAVAYFLVHFPRAFWPAMLFGTGAACLVLMTYAALHLQEPSSKYQLVACALYIVGVVLATGLYHVPRNNILDSFDPNSAEGITYWATYLEEWVRMNHVRTIAPLVAGLLLTISLRVD